MTVTLDLVSGVDVNDISDEFRKWHEWLERHTLTLVMHPDDVTPEIQEVIDLTPLMELEKNEFCFRGKMYLVKPWEMGREGDDKG